MYRCIFEGFGRASCWRRPPDWSHLARLPSRSRVRHGAKPPGLRGARSSLRINGRFVPESELVGSDLAATDPHTDCRESGCYHPGRPPPPKRQLDSGPQPADRLNRIPPQTRRGPAAGRPGRAPRPGGSHRPPGRHPGSIRRRRKRPATSGSPWRRPRAWRRDRQQSRPDRRPHSRPRAL